MSDIRIKLALDGASAVVAGVERVKASLGGMSNSIAALSGTLGVAAFGALVKGAINAADALDEMSGRYGVSAKELSALQLSFKQAGMAPEAMAKSLGKLQIEMAKGGEGLAAIGVKAKNADGTLRSTTDVLKDVADRFQGMQDGAGKTAYAMEIFGKSGADMVPLLNGGSEGIAEMTAMAERLGLVISDEAAAQAGAFNDTLELLGLGVQGVGSQIAAQLLPTLSGLAGQFLQSMTSGDRLKNTADFLASSLKVLYVSGLGIVEVFKTVGTTLGGVSAAVVAALSGDFAGAANILREMKTDIGASWKTTLADMSAAWNATGNASVEAMAKTMGAAKAAAPDVANLGKKAKEVKDEFADLLNKLTAKDAGLDPSFYKDLDTLYQGYVKNRIGTDDYRAAAEKLIGAQQFAKDIAKESAQALADAAAAQNKAYDDFEAAEAKQLKTVEDRIKAGRTMLEGLEQDIRLQGMSAKERQVATAMLELERQGVVKGTEAYEKYATQIREAIDIKAANDEHIKMWESIDQTAHDVFVNIFEDGAGTFKRLGQMLKAALLDWLYQMTVKKWIINISGQFTGGVGGQAAQVASGGGFGLPNLGGLGDLGSLLGNSSMGSLDFMGIPLEGFGQALGYVGMAIAAIKLIKSFKSPGEQHTGGFYSSSGATGMDAALGITDGNEAWARDMIKRANPEIEGLVKTTVDSVITATQANAKALGMDIALGIDAGFASNTNGKGKDKNNFGYFDITINGETVAEYMNRTLGTDLTQSVAQWTTDMADAAAQWVLGGEEAWKALAHQGEGASATLDRVALSLNSVNQMFDMLGHQIELVGIEGANAAAQFADLFGGLQQAQQAVGTYYSEFYSDAERSAYTTRMLSDELNKLGLQMPTTRDQFKGMVDAAIAAGDTELAAKLMAMSGAVASVLPATEAAIAAAERNDEALRQRVDRQKTLWQQQADAADALRGEVQVLFDALGGHITDLRAQALGPVLNAQQGQAFIDQALQAALGSGVLPDQAGLETAIAAARGGLAVGAGQYGNSIEASYAAAKLAGDLETLQGVAGQQLTQAERQYQAAVTQIDQLDQSLDLARDQLDLTQVGIDATLGVTDAIVSLQEALKPGSTGRVRQQQNSGGGGGGGGGYGGSDWVWLSDGNAPSGGGASSDPYSMNATRYDIYGGLLAEFADTRTAYEQAQVYLNASRGGELGLGSSDLIADAMLAAGATQAQVDQVAAAAAGYQDYVAQTGGQPVSGQAFVDWYEALPRLAIGTNYVPEDGPYFLHKGESVQPVPYNPAAGGIALGGGTQRLEALFIEMLDRIARLEGVIAQGNAHTKTTADTLTRVAPGDALIFATAPNIR